MPWTETRRLCKDRRRGAQRGQALAEFLVVVPILLLLLMAVIGFGQYILAQMVVLQSANRAARLGAVLYGDSTVSHDDAYRRTREAALGLLNAGLGGTDRSVIIEEVGDDLQVTVRYRSPVSVPFVRPWLGDRFEAEYESIYPIERDS